MQESYPVIAKVPTHILTWGKWIEESLGEHKEIVICITGNPGLPGFYTKFLSTVHECLNKDMPVWVIGHAGHDEASKNQYTKGLHRWPTKSRIARFATHVIKCSNTHGRQKLQADWPRLPDFLSAVCASTKPVPSLENNSNLYNLEGQLQHKIDFVRKYVPSDVKIHLIGHSIGCYLVMELLKIPDISDRIQHCYFLFPTIERMAESKSGFILTKVVKPIYFLVQWFYRCFSLLPNFIKIWIIYMYFLLSGIPKFYLGTALKYTNPSVMDKVWFMAMDEMEKVRDLDIRSIEQNKHRIKFYYGATDGWVPVKYYKQLRDKVHDVDAELCTRKIDHAFVLRSAEQMGFMVSEWIVKHKLYK